MQDLVKVWKTNMKVTEIEHKIGQISRLACKQTNTEACREGKKNTPDT